MPADLILYALVAAGLVFWLRSVLGTRHGEERERPSPYLSGEEPENPMSDQDMNITDIGNPAEQIAALAANPSKNHQIDNKTAENGLMDIAEADRDFDVEVFLDAA